MTRYIIKTSETPRIEINCKPINSNPINSNQECYLVPYP